VIISAVVVFGILAAIVGSLFATAPAPGNTASAPTEAPFQAEPTTPGAPVATLVPVSEKPTFAAPPPMTIDPAQNYTATITTPRGDIVIRLRPDLAPQTVNSFRFLANEGYYDGLTWHRVLPEFMAQGGDPTGTGMGGPGYTVPAEFSDLTFDRPGLLAMARSQDPNSAGSQFFITNAAAPWLDGQYTIFGEVTEGLDIVLDIPLRDPDTATTPGEQMLEVRVTDG
jgi:peptidylprolyl isomerase